MSQDKNSKLKKLKDMLKRITGTSEGDAGRAGKGSPNFNDAKAAIAARKKKIQSQIDQLKKVK